MTFIQIQDDWWLGLLRSIISRSFPHETPMFGTLALSDRILYTAGPQQRLEALAECS